VQRDRGGVTRKLDCRGVYLTELVEPYGALPRTCLFIYLLHASEGGDGRTHRRSKEDQEGHVLPGLFRRTPGSYQRDYYNSADRDDLQEVKDP
jgi:hypothetical protein